MVSRRGYPRVGLIRMNEYDWRSRRILGDFQYWHTRKDWSKMDEEEWYEWIGWLVWVDCSWDEAESVLARSQTFFTDSKLLLRRQIELHAVKREWESIMRASPC